MISPRNLDKLLPFVREMGYEVVSWDEPQVTDQQTPIYRPTVTNLKGNKNNNLAILVQKECIVIYDHAGQLVDQCVVSTDTWEASDNIKFDPVDLNKIKEEKRENFKKKWAHIISLKTEDLLSHPLSKNKKIQLKNSFVLQRTLHIPMQNQDGDIIGCQVRYNNLGKGMITGSTTINAYNILQEGEKEVALNVQLGYISESYTTACEIAEAAPSAFVACCAGIGQLLSVYDILCEKYPHTTFIIVLDKTKHNEYNAKQEALEKNIDNGNIPYIQLSKADPALVEMTDFNEYAIKFGKYQIKRYVSGLSSRHSPLPPELIGQTATYYTIVSRIDGEVHHVEKSVKSIIAISDRLAGKTFWESIIHLYGGSQQVAIGKWLQQEASLINTRDPKGIGIFKESDKYIANLTTGRYIIDQDKVVPTTDLKPVGVNIYVNKVTAGNETDLSVGDINPNDLRCLEDAWKQLYAENIGLLYGLIGWGVQGCYATLSDYRSHAWLLGSSGTGKSNLIEHVLPNLFRGIMQVIVNQTSAGLSQLMTESDGTENVPSFTLDEMGTETPDKRARNNEVLLMVRESTTTSEHAIGVRGTKEHKARIFRKQSAFIFASKTHFLEDMQDISRFMLYQLRFALISKRPQHFDELNDCCKRLNPGLMKAILLHSKFYKGMLYHVMNNLSEYIGDTKIYSHMHRTLSGSIAGTVIFFMGAYQLSREDAIARTKKELKGFLTKVVEYHSSESLDGSGFEEAIFRFTIRQDGVTVRLLDVLCEEMGSSGTYKPFWRDYGVKIEKVDGQHILYVQNNRAKINALFTNSMASDKIYDTMGTLIDRAAQKIIGKTRVSTRINGNPRKVPCYMIKIPQEYINGEEGELV